MRPLLWLLCALMTASPATAQTWTGVQQAGAVKQRAAKIADADAAKNADPDVIAHPLETLWRDLDEGERLSCTEAGYKSGLTVRSFSSRRLVNALMREHFLDIDRDQDRLYSRNSIRGWLGDAVARRMRELRSGSIDESSPENIRPADGIDRIARAMIEMLTLQNGQNGGHSILTWTSPDGERLELRNTDRLIFARSQPYEEDFLLRALNAPDTWAGEVLSDTSDRFRVLAVCPQYGDRFVSARRAPQLEDRFLRRVGGMLEIGADEVDVERPLGRRRGAGLSLTTNNENQTQIWDWELGVSVSPWRLPAPWEESSPEQINRDFFNHFATTPEEPFAYQLSGSTLRPYFVIKRRATIDREADTTDVNVDFVSFGLQLSSFLERGRTASRDICPSETTSRRPFRRMTSCVPAGPDELSHGTRVYKTERWRVEAPVSLEWVTDTDFDSSFARAQVLLTPSIGVVGDPRTAFRAPGFSRAPLLSRVFSPYMQILVSPAADYAEVFEPGETLPLQDIKRYFRLGGDFEFNVHFNNPQRPSDSRLRWFNSYRLRDDVTAGDRADAALFQSEISVLLPGERFSFGLEYEEGEDARTLERDERLQLIARYRM